VIAENNDTAGRIVGSARSDRSEGPLRPSPERPPVDPHEASRCMASVPSLVREDSRPRSLKREQRLGVIILELSHVHADEVTTPLLAPTVNQRCTHHSCTAED
jgi:hypothetical protein